MNNPNDNTLLFSIDLEDVRDWVRDGESYQQRVPLNTERYLVFLAKHCARATFFVVGALARKYPSLISEIVHQGHEIACHGDRHIQLDKLNAQEFRADLERNLEALQATGATDVKGFRAPTFSMTNRTRWAYEVLEDLGFEYSSSVLPAKNPLYGWPEFGSDPRRMSGSLWEIPITLHQRPMPRVPLVGGVYFRVIPFGLTRYALNRAFGLGKPVLSYMHPYDADTDQERFMHPDLNDSRVMNRLMYVGRSRVFHRLERIAAGCQLTDYRSYVRSRLN